MPGLGSIFHSKVSGSDKDCNMDYEVARNERVAWMEKVLFVTVLFSGIEWFARECIRARR